MKTKKLLYTAILALSFTSCVNDLDVVPLDPTINTADRAYQDAEDYENALAKVYAIWAMSGQDGAGTSDISLGDAGNTTLLRSWFILQTHPTDELKNANNDAWVPNLNYMNWGTAEIEPIEAVYQRCMYIVALANDFLKNLPNAPEEINQESLRAQARFCRALAYYTLMDTFGNPPYITENNYSITPSQIGRTEIFNFIETELKAIIESYAPGQRNEVAMHPNGLLWAQMDGVALTWMNAYVHGHPVTERAGYQVETNAFWYNAISFALEMEKKYGTKKNEFVSRWSKVQELIEANYQDMFWDPEAGYLADYVDNSCRNMDVRPNQLYAVSLDYSPVDDEVKSSVVMTVNNELVTTRGIRTLSPRNVKYRGVYEGSQIDRDLAYHQGCAFPSLLSPYMNICFKMMGSNFYKKAEYLTEGFYADISKHGVGAFSELYDGDPPHEAHGAISSACSTAALLRVYYLMDKNKKEEKK